ncbi:MAG: sugar ABC transporter substrate-binding protein [Lachnospiraceae bacterium]|nr:sugar ABC transporter substrate-binding protein [Lachnospiraceae bacterium]
MRAGQSDNHRKWNRNPNTWIMLLTIICVIATVVTAAYVLWFYQGTYHEETEQTVYDKYYMMITEDNKSSIWRSIYQGACEQAMAENVYVDWLGDDLFQGYSVEEQMQIAIASGVDGIIVTANENTEMTELVNKAAEENIPVVTLYGDNTQSARCSFVGIGSYNLGHEYGRLALQIIREKLAGQGVGLVSVQGNETIFEQVKVGSRERPVRVAVLVNAYAQGLDQNILCSGIQETIEQERGENLEIELELISVDDTNAFSVEESIRDIFMEREIPDIIICLNELHTTCVYQAVVDYNKVGQVNILGYYDSDTIINAIDRNVIYATVAIDTKQMGQFCIKALQEYHELGYTSQYFTADIRLIQKEDVEEYLGKGDSVDENDE